MRWTCLKCLLNRTDAGRLPRALGFLSGKDRDMQGYIYVEVDMVFIGSGDALCLGSGVINDKGER